VKTRKLSSLLAHNCAEMQLDNLPKVKSALGGMNDGIRVKELGPETDAMG
jgi:hypothetical protein